MVETRERERERLLLAVVEELGLCFEEKVYKRMEGQTLIDKREATNTG